MSIPYTHTATITRLSVAADGASRDSFGQPVATTSSVCIYDGRADYQDMSFRERRDIFGDEAVASAGWLYLPETAFPPSVRTDDRVSITGDSVTRAGVVMDVDRLSMRLMVRVEAQPAAA